MGKRYAAVEGWRSRAAREVADFRRLVQTHGPPRIASSTPSQGVPPRNATRDAIRRGRSEADPEAILRDAEPLVRGLVESESLPHEIQRLDTLLAELSARVSRAEAAAAREYGSLEQWVGDRRDELQDAANALAWHDRAALERLLQQIGARLGEIGTDPSAA